MGVKSRASMPSIDFTDGSRHLSGSDVSVRRDRGRSKWGEKKAQKGFACINIMKTDNPDSVLLLFFVATLLL